MKNSTMSFNFLNIDSGSAPDLPKIESSFLAYTPEKWREGTGDGMFTCTDEEKGVSDMYLIDDGKSGISVRYNHRDRGERRGSEFYSIADRKIMDNIIDVGEDQFVPEGSLLAPTVAWMVLNEFVRSPHKLPTCVEWISSQDVKWPDDW